jgi:hypothetical protein
MRVLNLFQNNYNVALSCFKLGNINHLPCVSDLSTSRLKLSEMHPRNARTDQSDLGLDQFVMIGNLKKKNYHWGPSEDDGKFTGPLRPNRELLETASQKNNVLEKN